MAHSKGHGKILVTKGKGAKCCELCGILKKENSVTMEENRVVCKQCLKAEAQGNGIKMTQLGKKDLAAMKLVMDAKHKRFCNGARGYACCCQEFDK